MEGLSNMNSSNNKYTCNEYREEMILLALQKKLSSEDLTEEEKNKILAEIKEIEKKMGME